MKYCQVAIIGGGCAGLTAGLYCGRAELEPVLFAGNISDKGGMLSKTSIVENYPGFPHGINGSDLINNMEQQAAKYGCKIVDCDIIQIDKHEKEKEFKLVTDSGDIYLAKAVIVATGSKPNKLGLLEEDRFWSNGVSSCAVCDGALYKNKRIMVVGGGDSACEEALFLTKFSHVTLVHRRDTFRASAILQKRLLSNPRINIIYNTQITKLFGNKYLEAVELTNNNDGSKDIVKVDGLFYGLGLTPNIQLVKHLVDTDGIVKKYKRSMTSEPGIFVAGDVNDDLYRQAVVAAGHGCMAALDVIAYLDMVE